MWLGRISTLSQVQRGRLIYLPNRFYPTTHLLDCRWVFYSANSRGLMRDIAATETCTPVGATRGRRMRWPSFKLRRCTCARVEMKKIFGSWVDLALASGDEELITYSPSPFPFSFPDVSFPFHLVRTSVRMARCTTPPTSCAILFGPRASLTTATYG